MNNTKQRQPNSYRLENYNAVENHSVLGMARFQLGKWGHFLRTAKNVVQDRALSFDLEKVWVVFPDPKAPGKWKEEIRYYLALDEYPPKVARFLEKELFEEGARWMLDERNEWIKIRYQHPGENYLILQKELSSQPAFSKNEREISDQNEALKTFESRIKSKKVQLRKKVLQSKAKAPEESLVLGMSKGKLNPNSYQIDQQLYALKALNNHPLRGHQALLQLFAWKNDDFWEPLEFPPLIEEWKILDDDRFDGVEEQRTFVSKAMSTPDFALLEGPPGSGKTTTIIELILQLILAGKRVLLCSATHVAIDNVLERILKKYANQCQDLVVPVRISSNPEAVDEAVRPYLLERLSKTLKTKLLEDLGPTPPLSQPAIPER